MKQLVASYNLAIKRYKPEFYEKIDMIRLNSPWYTLKELEEILETVEKPKFVDINIKERHKPKITSHNFEKLVSICSKNNVDWIGISSVEDPSLYDRIKHFIGDSSTRVCAKIETQEGYLKSEEIIKKFDGIMVDCEDLANEVGWKKTEVMRDAVYKMCDSYGKPTFRLSGVIFEMNIDCRTVYTYGAFDLLHPGHINMLGKAKDCGDRLVVGVVGDNAISDLKGKDRPIQSQSDRMSIVSNLKCVDLVLPQETYDPVPNLEKINPDVLVKGDDWNYIPGEKWIKKHKKILVKPRYSSGWSTSGIVKKIRGE